MRSQTRTYVETPRGVAFTLTGTSAAGNPIRVEYTAAYDGRDYPLKGSPSVDSVAVTRLDRFTVEAIEKKDGRPVFRIKRVIAPDGKTMTVTSTGTNASGVAVKNVLVFDKK